MAAEGEKKGAMEANGERVEKQGEMEANGVGMEKKGTMEANGERVEKKGAMEANGEMVEKKGAMEANGERVEKKGAMEANGEMVEKKGAMEANGERMEKKGAMEANGERAEKKGAAEEKNVTSARIILLRSSDGEVRRVSEAVASLSGLIRGVIEAGCADDVVELPNVEASTLDMVLEYCNKHADLNAAAATKPDSDLDDAAAATKPDSDLDAAAATKPDSVLNAATATKPGSGLNAAAATKPDSDPTATAVTNPDSDPAAAAVAKPDCDPTAAAGGSSSSSVDTAASEDLEAWDRKFLDLLSLDALYDLVLAANYLDIEGLLNAICQKVADMIKGKTPDQIRATFNIAYDFTPEDEAELRQQYAWAFDE